MKTRALYLMRAYQHDLEMPLRFKLCLFKLFFACDVAHFDRYSAFFLFQAAIPLSDLTGNRFSSRVI